ncbi:MAG: hypothetical protein U5L03_07345 [Burkholderiaceae bacterium]|nr:hypothetical protein [Burkholderiaceae bacterium]
MRAAVAAGLALVAAVMPAWAADYSFDASEIEPRAYEVNSFVEGRYEHFWLRSDAALLPLSFSTPPSGNALDRGTVGFELGGKYRKDMLGLYARVRGDAAVDQTASTSDFQWLEGGLRLSPSEKLSVDLGKQVQRWGKGYAWNPVGFFERPKDPNDPQQSREGYVMASADAVTSRPGTLAAVGFTPVVMPVSSSVNDDYGAPGHTNLGAKLYLLVADTDIDLMWAGKGSRPERFGFDFSRNLGTQLEVHGEWARAIGVTRRELVPSGSVSTRTANADSWLIGARYLSENEVTVIGELYRNGTGFDEDQLGRFYALLDQAFAAGGGQALQAQARSLAQAGYGRANPGRNYAYLRVSAKDPFDWLYVSPSVTSIVNLDDRSYQLTFELLYTGWENVELRLRGVLTNGDDATEFGEKPAAQRVELRLRLYF